MFPQAELIAFPDINFSFNSEDIPKLKTVSGSLTTNWTNQWWDSTTVQPFTPLVPGTIIVYPPIEIPSEGAEGWPGLPGPIGLPGMDSDEEIVVLPKDPIKKRIALRELLRDKVEEPDEREGRRIDLGEEQEE